VLCAPINGARNAPYHKERQAYLPYDEADLAQDRATLDRLLPK